MDTFMKIPCEGNNWGVAPDPSRALPCTQRGDFSSPLHTPRGNVCASRRFPMLRGGRAEEFGRQFDL